jgi:hypothetical protein
LTDDTWILQYVDDLALFIASDNAREAVQILQDSVDRVSCFLMRQVPGTVAEKSQLLIFSRKCPSSSSMQGSPNITIYGCLVPRVTSARFRGVWFNDRLKGSAHLRYLITKGRKLADVIYSLSGFDGAPIPVCLFKTSGCLLLLVQCFSNPINPPLKADFHTLPPNICIKH